MLLYRLRKELTVVDGNCNRCLLVVVMVVSLGLLRMDHLDLIWPWVDLGFGCIGCFFHCRRDFYGLRERQLLFLLTEHGLMRMASLLMAQMKQVRIASSSGFLMAGKSHVVVICRILAASSVDVSPGFLLMVLQNLYRSLTVNCVGSYSDLTWNQ